MDIFKTLKELYEEKRRLDTAIARLENRASAKPVKSRRGRKSMSAAERQQVSRRMKSYWEAWRAEKSAPNRPRNAGPGSGEPAITA